MTIPAYTDYYKILGVNKNASQKEIRDAYRHLARKYHPDVNPGNKEAASRFREIHEAYAVLADPHKRRTYDARGSAAMQRPQQGHRPGARPHTPSSTATPGAAGGAFGAAPRRPRGQPPSGGRAGGGLDLGVIRISLGLKTVDDLLAGLDRVLRGPADE